VLDTKEEGSTSGYIYKRHWGGYARGELRHNFRQKLEDIVYTKEGDKENPRQDPRLELSDYRYIISIITSSIKGSKYLSVKNPHAWITTRDWQKRFSPPSLFEYLVHAIMRAILSMNDLESHEDTFGCCRDYTRKKHDTRGDITLGYLCDKHKNQLKQKRGEDYTSDVLQILSGRWIGSNAKHGSVAYNLMRSFRFNLDRDSGFNKTPWDHLRDFFHDASTKAILVVITAALTFIVTYVLRGFLK